MRLNPVPAKPYYRHLGGPLCESGRYDEAIALFKEAINRDPDDLFSHEALAWAYIDAGHEERACAEAAEVVKINPEFSPEKWAKITPFKYQDLARRH